METSPAADSACLEPSPPPTPKDGRAPWLLYDGECPFCSGYVNLLRLREAVGGPVRLVDARAGGPELDEATAAGLSLDEGMVLQLGGRYYHGGDCVHALALLTSPVGGFNRTTAWIFTSPRRARLLYPWLRAVRNGALKVLGRRKIGR